MTRKQTTNYPLLLSLSDSDDIASIPTSKKHLQIAVNQKKTSPNLPYKDIKPPTEQMRPNNSWSHPKQNFFKHGCWGHEGHPSYGVYPAVASPDPLPSCPGVSKLPAAWCVHPSL